MELKDKEYLIRVTEFDGLEFDGITFTQNDTNTCRLNFELIEEVDTATIVIDKNDNTQVIDNLVHIEGNNYYYDMPISAINVVGTHKAYIMTYGHSEDRRTLGVFKYKIIAEPSLEDIATETELPILSQLIFSVNELNNTVTISENTRISNENTRISNENTRISNENTRVTAEIGRANEFANIKTEFEDLKQVAVDSNVNLQNQINVVNTSLEYKANLEHIHNEYSLEGHAHSPQVNCDTVDNLHFICLTRTQFDALSTKDSSTVYLVKEG